MRKLLGTAMGLAVVAGSVVLAAPGHAATWTIEVDDAEVDVRGYHGTVSARVTDGNGNPVAGVPLVFQKYRDGQARAGICTASTGADGRASCVDDPYPVGYGPRVVEVDPTVADQQVLVYVANDTSSFAFGIAHFRAEPHCQPMC